MSNQDAHSEDAAEGTLADEKGEAATDKDDTKRFVCNVKKISQMFSSFNNYV